MCTKSAMHQTINSSNAKKAEEKNAKKAAKKTSSKKKVPIISSKGTKGVTQQMTSPIVVPFANDSFQSKVGMVNFVHEHLR